MWKSQEEFPTLLFGVCRRIRTRKYEIMIKLSTVVCTCWNSRSTLQGISQELMMIEPCFKINFLNLYIAPASDESVCSISTYLHWKKLFYKLWQLQYHISPNKRGGWRDIKLTLTLAWFGWTGDVDPMHTLPLWPKSQGCVYLSRHIYSAKYGST